LKPSSSVIFASPNHDHDGHEVWDHLDQFLLQLQAAQDVGRRIRATLDMVRQTTRAGAAFLCTGRSHTVREFSGPVGADLDACSAFARELLASASPAEGFALRTDLKRISPGIPVPSSAALVRLSRSRNAWIVALRFDAAPPLSMRDVKMISLARRLLVQQQQQQDNHDQLRDMLFSLVRCLTASLDARDPYTWGHSERVARIAVRLGEQMNLPDGQRSELYLGGLLHDVGKIGVPDEVLRKPGTLTQAEMAQIQQHVLIGDAIVAHVSQLAHLRPLVRSHHERFDGAGYPDKLAGEAIPLPARILAVADSCDAMMSDRPYRRALPTDRIEAILQAGAGQQWDPVVIAALMRCEDEVFAISQRGLGESVVRAVEHALGARHFQPGKPWMTPPPIRAEHGAGAVCSFLGLRPSASGLAVRPVL
jgi:HD-GYP domain-containing protein (c-di-GMP phosphodiesterase class II)